MIIKELYRYEREEGKITVSPIKPECDYTLRYRLIAEEGKELTKDGENFTSCVDVESPDDWYEVDAVVRRVTPHIEGSDSDDIQIPNDVPTLDSEFLQKWRNLL